MIKSKFSQFFFNYTIWFRLYILVLGIELLFNKIVFFLLRIHRKMDLLSTSAAYWLKWQVFLCFLSLMTTIIMAFYVIKKYEGPKGRRSRSEQQEDNEDDIGVLFKHELWEPCWRQIHPAWLLGYRLCGFFTLLFISIVEAIVLGGTVFYYYTEYVFSSSMHP